MNREQRRRRPSVVEDAEKPSGIGAHGRPLPSATARIFPRPAITGVPPAALAQGGRGAVTVPSGHSLHRASEPRT